jgi:hypothetical protein
VGKIVSPKGDIASEGSAHVFDFSVMDVDQDGKISE